MKKFIKTLSMLTLLAAFSSTFAADVTCPPPNKLRAYNFVTAYKISNNTWTLISEAIPYRDHDWNVKFSVVLLGVIDPAMALDIGQNYFNHSPLLEQPSSQTSGETTECNYTPADAKYSVTAETPVKYGLS